MRRVRGSGHSARVPTSIELAASGAAFSILHWPRKVWPGDHKVVGGMSLEGPRRGRPQISGLRTLYRTSDSKPFLMIDQRLPLPEPGPAVPGPREADDGAAREVLWRAGQRGASPTRIQSTRRPSFVAGGPVEVVQTLFSDPNLIEVAFRWANSDVTVVGWGFTNEEVMQFVVKLLGDIHLAGT